MAMEKSVVPIRVRSFEIYQVIIQRIELPYLNHDSTIVASPCQMCEDEAGGEEE
jgi:hypothetical protein